MDTEPTTLQEAILYFSDPANCREYLMARRWADGVVCPKCGSSDIIYLEKYNRWHCRAKHEAPQFTLKTGTIMEDSPIGLDKWLMAMWQIVNSKNGISSYEIHRAIGITQKSAWFLEHRIRLALANGTLDKLSGEIEADETFVGGKVKNMHRRSKRKLQATNDGNWGKTVVLGLLQREGNVRAAAAPSRHKHQVHSNIIENVEDGSTLYTDEFTSYQDLPATFTREVINHLQGYVNGKISTNQMENFWSLLKRGLKGTYVSVDPAHLQAYVDEQVFRFNNRKDNDGKSLTDADRFARYGVTRWNFTKCWSGTNNDPLFRRDLRYDWCMKPLPAPHVPGSTDAERMDNAVRKMFSVSKEELLKREATWKRMQARKKRAKKPA